MMDLKNHQQTITQAFDPFSDAVDLLDACQLVHQPENMSSADRLRVYQHSITAAQQRVLAMVYPVCKQILGDDCFDTLARDYAWHRLSNCPDLNGYGETFAVFLTEQLMHHESFTELPYLADLARLEWHWHQALYARDDPLFDSENLHTFLANGELAIVPQISHALSLVNSPWPLMEIWQLHQDKLDQQTLDVQEHSQYLVIFRREENPYLEQVDAEIFTFLQYAQQGMTLINIAEHLEDKAEKAFAKLSQMAQYGWITGFRAVN